MCLGKARSAVHTHGNARETSARGVGYTSVIHVQKDTSTHQKQHPDQRR